VRNPNVASSALRSADDSSGPICASRARSGTSFTREFSRGRGACTRGASRRCERRGDRCDAVHAQRQRTRGSPCRRRSRAARLGRRRSRCRDRRRARSSRSSRTTPPFTMARSPKCSNTPARKRSNTRTCRKRAMPGAPQRCAHVVPVLAERLQGLRSFAAASCFRRASRRPAFSSARVKSLRRIP